MNKKYTRKQIQEAINYWQRQLETIEVIEKMLPLVESKDDKAKQFVAQQIKNEIKTPEDVKEFVYKHDREVQATNNSFLKKLWNGLKNGITKGVKFIADHWQLIVFILIVAALAIAGLYIADLPRKFRDWYMTTPAFEMHHAEGNNGLNAFFDPGGWY